MLLASYFILPDVIRLKGHIILKENNQRQTPKILFASPESADFVETRCFKCLGIFVQPTHIQKERFYHFQQCYKCFLYDHYTLRCTLHLGKCSRCSLDHNYRVCDYDSLKCTMCEGDHTAIFPECSHRHMKIRKTQEARQTSTNTQVQSGALPSSQLSPTFDIQLAVFLPYQVPLFPNVVLLPTRILLGETLCNLLLPTNHHHHHSDCHLLHQISLLRLSLFVLLRDFLDLLTPYLYRQLIGSFYSMDCHHSIYQMISFMYLLSARYSRGSTHSSTMSPSRRTSTSLHPDLVPSDRAQSYSIPSYGILPHDFFFLPYLLLLES